MSEYSKLCQFFGVKKIGEIHFVHAVNSQSLLERALSNPKTNILEGDISISKDGEIIMAHPPETRSDLKFSDWLSRAIEGGKGIKLDFKIPEVVEPCLKELAEIEPVQPPIFLNADVLKGPGGDPSSFDPRWFVRICSKYFPGSILSIGWKTKCVGEDRYTMANVSEMLSLLSDCPMLITFPIRAFYVRGSWKNLTKLKESPRFSLTLWNNEPVEPGLLGWIKENTNREITFYDLIKPDGSPLAI